MSPRSRDRGLFICGGIRGGASVAGAPGALPRRVQDEAGWWCRELRSAPNIAVRIADEGTRMDRPATERLTGEEGGAAAPPVVVVERPGAAAVERSTRGLVWVVLGLALPSLFE